MSTFKLNLNTIETALQKIGVEVEHITEQNMLFIRRRNAPNLPLRVVSDSEGQMVSFAIVSDFKIPKAHTADVSCAIALANGMVNIGSWCLNSQEAEVYYRLTLPTEGLMCSQSTIRGLMEITLGHANMYMETFRSIASGKASFTSIIEATIQS